MRKFTFLLAALMCGAWCATAQNTEKGYEYVDLGLPSGLKWATCNVGATTPEAYGNYYAWGETTTKTTYSWDTYTLTTDGGSTFTKYNTTDSKTVLEPEDDAAAANWGGAWRMPTDEEWTELREKCTWTWTTQNGVNGYEVKSKTNENSIFLPAAGFRGVGGLSGAGSLGYCWSSSFNANDPGRAWNVPFSSDDVRGLSSSRYYGLSVRPVLTTYSITLAAENGTVTGAGTYPQGTAVTLTATAEDGYYFVQWSDGNSENPRTITVTEDVALTAEFAANPVYNAVGGLFSVGEGKQVQFSAGNLQYTQSADVWAFAAHQYDMLGTANVNGSELANTIDLFGWSGSTATAKWGISTSTDYNDYSGDFADWGQNVGNGTTWRTLTNDEWNYLRSTRANAANLMGVARINLDEAGTTYANGLILLPDTWTCPEGITFKSGFASEYSVEAYGVYQTFTLEQWQKLEAAGAVFLPASGRRDGSSVGSVQDVGYYWSATPYDSFIAYSLRFLSLVAVWYDNYRYYGQAVRLVQDYVPYTVTATCDAEQGSVSGAGTYPQGTEVTLTATAEDGYYFVQWSDGNSENPRTITVTEDVALTAEFAANPVYNAVAGVFSVGEGKQVQFSAGNLQYTQSADVWAFAAHQYDMLGTANVNGSELANTIDLFGWSGSTATAKWGVSTSTSNSDYSGDFADWGQNIGDGTTWRTLTNDEWTYLRSTRANAASLMGVARINLDEAGTTYANGLILLPDSWTCPEDITFKLGFASDYSIQAYAAYQTFTLEQWEQLEAAGAVFLPASGYRDGSSIGNVQYGGNYWSATPNGSYGAYCLYFYSDEADWGRSGRYDGRAVRLVKDCYTVTATCDAEQGSVSGAGTYQKGTEITLTATAEDGYYFVQWSDGNSENPRTITVTEDVALTAEFAANPVYNAVGGVFSVGEGKQVQFSAGNLQYTQSADVWAFAAHQYDMVGTANGNGSELGNTIDLFGWSGSTATAKWGISASNNNSDYSGDFAEWGQNIGDGNTWRTLTDSEWQYVVSGRTSADSKKGIARINLDEAGTTYANGIILLPDNWICPEDITFKSGFSSDFSIEAYGVYQTFTLEQWEKLEAAGAVFLPASGYRYGSSIYDVRSSGGYWSATPYGSYSAYYLSFYSNLADWYSDDRCYGQAVRLVKDCYTVTATCDAEQGSVSGAGTYAKGTEVTLTATAAEHYHFVEWSDGTKAATYTFTLTQDTTLTAVFAIDQHEITASGENGTVKMEVNGAETAETVFDYGTEVTLTATAAEGYYFVQWSDGNSENPRTITVTADVTLAAEFAPNTTTALEAVAAQQIYTVDGRIVCAGEFRIYDLLGRDVTRLNGSLCGVYIVKVGEAAVKVVVR